MSAKPSSAESIGILGGRAIVYVLNRLGLPQGLHAPFVATATLVVFGLAQWVHASGFLAVYLAGLIVGNRPTRAHNSIVAFLDAATWLAQIAMFLLLGLLAWPERLPERALPALVVALTLMLIARPVAVFLCLAPFRFTWREKVFISWVGLRGAVGIFLASIPLLVGLPKAQLYFDVGFVVVLVSLLVQGWTIGKAARLLHVALPRADVSAHRVELDLPGQLSQELVGYPVVAESPYLRRGITPSWAKLTLVIRDERVHTPEEAGQVREGDHVYFLAPPERAPSLDRFFVEMPAPARPDPSHARRFLRVGRGDARRACGGLRPAGRAGRDRQASGHLFRGAVGASAAFRRCREAWPGDAAGAYRQGRPCRHGGITTRGARAEAPAARAAAFARPHSAGACAPALAEVMLCTTKRMIDPEVTHRERSR